jgi:hypothetical protein
MKDFATREEWLVALTEALRPMFEDAGYGIPVVRISCSWPSKSVRKRLGECWHSKASEDGSRQVFITPRLAKTIEVAEVVVHELGHSCLPDDAGHKAPFVKLMKAVGLEGKAKSTHAGPELLERLNAMCKDLGEYPHSPLNLNEQRAKQGTRMLKLVCPTCGYVCRTTAKWIDVGLPTCCCGEEMIVEEK